jgi:hypothetical protein
MLSLDELLLRQTRALEGLNEIFLRILSVLDPEAIKGLTDVGRAKEATARSVYLMPRARLFHELKRRGMQPAGRTGDKRLMNDLHKMVEDELNGQREAPVPMFDDTFGQAKEPPVEEPEPPVTEEKVEPSEPEPPVTEEKVEPSGPEPPAEPRLEELKLQYEPADNPEDLYNAGVRFASQYGEAYLKHVIPMINEKATKFSELSFEDKQNLHVLLQAETTRIEEENRKKAKEANNG